MSLIDEIHFENQRELEESRKNPKKLTNFEKIKQMSVEDMATIITCPHLGKIMDCRENCFFSCFCFSPFKVSLVFILSPVQSTHSDTSLSSGMRLMPEAGGCPVSGGTLSPVKKNPHASIAIRAATIIRM